MYRMYFASDILEMETWSIDLCAGSRGAVDAGRRVACKWNMISCFPVAGGRKQSHCDCCMMDVPSSNPRIQPCPASCSILTAGTSLFCLSRILLTVVVSLCSLIYTVHKYSLNVSLSVSLSCYFPLNPSAVASFYTLIISSVLGVVCVCWGLCVCRSVFICVGLMQFAVSTQ